MNISETCLASSSLSLIWFHSLHQILEIFKRRPIIKTIEESESNLKTWKKTFMLISVHLMNISSHQMRLSLWYSHALRWYDYRQKWCENIRSSQFSFFRLNGAGQAVDAVSSGLCLFNIFLLLFFSLLLIMTKWNIYGRWSWGLDVHRPEKWEWRLTTRAATKKSSFSHT